MEQTKFYILYKTTCTVTGNFYIGVHSTTNLEDGYLGSGLRLSRSVKKHGKENHFREILELFETREELMTREKEIVNEKLLQDEKCLNIQKGGNTGWKREAQLKNSEKGKNSLREKLKDEKWRAEYANTMSVAMKKSNAAGKHQMPNWLGRKHSPETLQKFRERPRKNGSDNTVWMYHLEQKKTKKILRTEVESFIATGWKKGRKLKF